MDDPATLALGDAATTVIRRVVTTAVLVIAVLSFAFGFGNGWQLGLSLGVPGWIAPLVAPAVDLSVIALLASVQYLRAGGLGGRLVEPRLLLVFCGLVTFALNTARPIMAGQLGRTCFDAVAPGLLIGWSEVAPRLLALLHSSVPDKQVKQEDGPETSVLADDKGGVLPAQLIEQAYRLSAAYRQRTGKPITRDALRARLHVSNAIAGDLLRLLRQSQPLSNTSVTESVVDFTP